jgi:hypothetical protein
MLVVKVATWLLVLRVWLERSRPQAGASGKPSVCLKEEKKNKKEEIWFSVSKLRGRLLCLMACIIAIIIISA